MHRENKLLYSNILTIWPTPKTTNISVTTKLYMRKHISEWKDFALITKNVHFETKIIFLCPFRQHLSWFSQVWFKDQDLLFSAKFVKLCAIVFSPNDAC